MSQSINQEVTAQIAGIEELRNSRVLVLSASKLDMEILPELYQQLLVMGKVKRLDVVIQSQGGIVNAARRIALLLREFTEHLCFIVPYQCASSATLLALSADEILAGPMAAFSPIDPHLHGGSDDDSQASSALSCLDIKKFGDMCQAWFGADEDAAREQSLALLCNSIFPPTLTAFYRTTLELQEIGEQLIRFQLPELSAQERGKIVKHLMFDYHSHNYAITGEEMSAIGLNIRSAAEVEPSAWQLSRLLQQTIGGGLRQDLDATWYDALLATRDSFSIRENRGGAFMPKWSCDTKL